MPRLPIPGSDKGQWGTLLNEFLSVEHNDDGSLKSSGSLGTYAPLANPIFSGSVTVPTPTSATDAVTKQYVDDLVVAGAPDATTSSKGVVQLAGDLDGTATNPQIASGVITNTHVSSSAAIAKTKLAALNIVDADVAAGANIAQSKVANLADDLAGKANINHSHIVDDVTNLQTLLDSKETPAGAQAKVDAHTAASDPHGDRAYTDSQLGSYAPLANPTFTGTVTVPTPSNATDAVTKQYVDSSTAGLAQDDEVVKLTGDQTIAGNKTFTGTTVSDFGADGKFMTIAIPGMGSAIAAYADASQDLTHMDLAIAPGSIIFGDGSGGSNAVVFSESPNTLNFSTNDNPTRLVQVADPQNPHDAATKAYVDTSIEAISGEEDPPTALNAHHTPPVVVMSYAERVSAGGLNWFPDGTMSFFWTGASISGIGANGGNPAIWEIDPNGAFIDNLISNNFSIQNIKDSNSNYAAGGPVFDASKTGLTGTSSVMVYHNEETHDPGQFYASIGLAKEISGQYHDCGLIFRPELTPANPNAQGRPVELGGGAFAIKDGFLYVFAKDFRPDGSFVQMAVSRASMSDVQTALDNTDVPEFLKYHNGSFSQPGLAGSSTNIFPDVPGWLAWYDCAYLEDHQMWMMVYSYDTNNSIEWNIGYKLSKDLINWTPHTPIFSASTAEEKIYVTISSSLQENASFDQRNISGNTFDVYYTHSAVGGGSRWSDARLDKISVTLDFDPINVGPPTAPNHAASKEYVDYRSGISVATIASSSAPYIDTDRHSAVSITALSTGISSFTTNLSGSPTDFQRLMVRIKDDGTTRSINWGSAFEAKGADLPTATTPDKVTTVGLIYDSVTEKWGCVAAVTEA